MDGSDKLLRGPLDGSAPPPRQVEVGFTGGTLQRLVQFAYTGAPPAELAAGEALDLLRAAHETGLSLLVDACEARAIANLTDDGVVTVFRLARTYGCERLEAAALERARACLPALLSDGRVWAAPCAAAPTKAGAPVAKPAAKQPHTA